MNTSRKMKRSSNPSRAAVVRLFSLVLALVGLSWIPIARAQSYALTELWHVMPDAAEYSFMNSSNNLTRGLTYNPVTDHVLVVSRTDSNAIHILKADNGAVLGKLPYDADVVKGGNFPVNMIGVTDDGVIYVGNLTTAATGGHDPFKLYRWADEAASPQMVYSGDPSGGSTIGANPRRFGDSIAVRGTGPNTQILLGTYNHALGLLTTEDGVNFTAALIATDNAWPQDSRWGVAWGTGDTFWIKQRNGALRKMSLDIANRAATAVNQIDVAAAQGGPLDVDLGRNLVAIIDTATHALRLYDIFDPANPIQQDTARSFPMTGANLNATGAVALRNGKLFALESNNGILAYSLQEITLPATIMAQPASVTVWEGATYSITAGYGGTHPISFQWRLNGKDIPGATESSLKLANVRLDQQGAYSVAVSNSLGEDVSAAATLTVAPAAGSTQTMNVGQVLAGSRPYLTYRPVGDTLAGYRGYGLAINPVTTNIIIVTRQDPTNLIAVMDIEGNHLHYIDYSGMGVPTTANPMNRVDVADDGAVYVGNLVTDATTNPFRVYRFGDDSASPAERFMAYSGDPANGAANPSVWGHTFSVRGAGLNTEILIGSSYSNFKTFAILRPDEYYAFTSTLITVPDAPAGFCGLGLDWGPGANTVWGKMSGGQLYLIQYDLATGAGTVLYTCPTVPTIPSALRFVPSSFTGLKHDPVTKLLAGLQNFDGGENPFRPVSLLVYDVADTVAGPFLVDQEPFPTYNSDIEFTGVVDFGKGYLAALGVNNGVMICKVSDESIRPPRILSHPASAIVDEGETVSFSVVADSTLAGLTYEWYRDGEIVPDAADATLSLDNVETSQAGVYVARVSNTSGFRDSASATLTVIGPFAILDVTSTAEAVTLTWESVATMTYQVQSGATPSDNWTNIGDVITATGATASYTDMNPDPSMRFYRVVRQ